MCAGCPPAGSALLAPRLLLPHTASPLACYARGFELNTRLRTRWHGACFALRVGGPRCSAAPAEPREAGARASPSEERDAHCFEREQR